MFYEVQENYKYYLNNTYNITKIDTSIYKNVFESTSLDIENLIDEVKMKQSNQTLQDGVSFRKNILNEESLCL